MSAYILSFPFQLQIPVEIEGLHSEGYDEANLLALPLTKHKARPAAEPAPTGKRLSKKERKRLEKIVNQKNKKAKVMSW